MRATTVITPDFCTRSSGTIVCSLHYSREGGASNPLCQGRIILMGGIAAAIVVDRIVDGDGRIDEAMR